MRCIVVVAILFFSFSLQAQTMLPVNIMGYHSPLSLANKGLVANNISNKNWFLSSYSTINAGYIFFKGGSTSYISAPMGIQLNRRLNNNFYAFAGLSVNPTYLNFNQPIPLSGMQKGYYPNGMFGTNKFGVYPRAELGLMYINDEKTFSVSGSISVQRGGYTGFPYQPKSVQVNEVNRER
ncbi:MAG: hypothetical protein JST63_01655 [Bacteroidetes bacterium]|nr:hypothetical protein [Bacteroidota bacterium]